MSLFTYVRQCLATEMRLIRAADGQADFGLPNILTANSAAAEILQSIEVVRRRTQVSRYIVLAVLN